MTELGGVGFEGWQSERDHRGELIRAGTRWASGLTTRASSQLPVDPRRAVCAALGVDGSKALLVGWGRPASEETGRLLLPRLAGASHPRR